MILIYYEPFDDEVGIYMSSIADRSSDEYIECIGDIQQNAKFTSKATCFHRWCPRIWCDFEGILL